MPMPRKIAGRLISTIDALIVAMSTPSVVFDSATHLYFGWSLPQRVPPAGRSITGSTVSAATASPRRKLVGVSNDTPVRRRGDDRPDDERRRGAAVDEKDLFSRIHALVDEEHKLRE